MFTGLMLWKGWLASGADAVSLLDASICLACDRLEFQDRLEDFEHIYLLGRLCRAEAVKNYRPSVALRRFHHRQSGWFLWRPSFAWTTDGGVTRPREDIGRMTSSTTKGTHGTARGNKGVRGVQSLVTCQGRALILLSVVGRVACQSERSTQHEELFQLQSLRHTLQPHRLN